MSRMAPVPAMKMFNRSSPSSYCSQTNCTAAMTPAGVVGIVVAKAVAASCNSSWSSVSRRCVPLAAGSLSSRDARVQNCQSRGQAPQDVPMSACIVRLCRKLHHASWSVSPLLNWCSSRALKASPYRRSSCSDSPRSPPEGASSLPSLSVSGGRVMPACGPRRRQPCGWSCSSSGCRACRCDEDHSALNGLLLHYTLHRRPRGGAHPVTWGL